MGALVLLAAAALSAAPPESPAADGLREIPRGQPFAFACTQLTEVPDACAITREAAAMLGPTYDPEKATTGEERLRKLGYRAQYYPAKSGMFGDLTDVFLAAKEGTNRLYVIVTGTESGRDWFENAKAQAYTTVWRDGYYYIPPGHAGFRSGALNVIGELFVRNEFDGASLACPGGGRSKLAKFVCASEVRRRPEDKVDVVLVGHSRGAGILQLLAPAFAGYEIVMPFRGVAADVRPQTHWPLRLGAVIGFATPVAIYTRTDSEAGLNLPLGAPNQWEVYRRAGVAQRTLHFLNERDIVPLLSLGLGAQLGYRFRVEPDGPKRNRTVFAGYGSPNTVALWDAHGSGGYCEDIYHAFAIAEPSDDTGKCDKRSFSQPAAEGG